MEGHMINKSKKYVRTVIINDVHIPFEDEIAVRLVFKFMKWFNPELVILNGDIMDCYMLSKFAKKPFEGKRFKEEIDETKVFLDELKSVTPNACRYFIVGN